MMISLTILRQNQIVRGKVRPMNMRQAIIKKPENKILNIFATIPKARLRYCIVGSSKFRGIMYSCVEKHFIEFYKGKKDTRYY